MMDIKILVLGAFIAVGVCGCSRQQEPQNLDVINIRTADANLALAEVGNEVVSVGDIRSRLDFERGLWSYRNAKLPEADRQNRLAAFTNQRMKRVLSDVIHQKVVSILAKEKKVSLTKGEQQVEVKRHLKAFKFSGDFVELAKKIGCDSEYALRQICASALLKKIVVVEDPQANVVTEQEIDAGLQRLSDYYDRAVASNAVTWATCSNLIQQIDRGLDFVKAGEEYGYNNGAEGEMWASFSREEIENADLREWAFTASVGAMKIFELDDGISIVKIIGVENRMGDMAEVDLARINFAMVEPEPEPRTREYVRQALLKWKTDQVQKHLFEDAMKAHPLKFLHEEAQISY